MKMTYDVRFNYVTVVVNKKDYMADQLSSDLEAWTSHLYRVEKEDTILYRGLIPKKELDHLLLLQSVSPYGNGYNIFVDGLPLSMYGSYRWKVVRGIA